jgi:Fungal specific transcription factor domain
MAQRQQDSMRGYVELLFPMYMDSAEDSVLRQATSAVALATLSNSYRARELRMEAHRAYGKALRAVSPLINDPVMARSDELLMSILLFSLYEVRS